MKSKELPTLHPERPLFFRNLLTLRVAYLAYFFFGVVAGVKAQGLADPPPVPTVLQAGDLKIVAREQQTDGPLRMARGNVELRMNNVIFNANEIDYNEETGDIEARSNVRYRNSESGEDLYAEKVVYNARTETGIFYDTRGTVASASQGGIRILTTDNPFYIEGKVVNKARGHYIVHDGFVTNCDVSKPWWTLHSPRTRIVPGKAATIHRGVFRLRGVPIFYFPVFRKSLERLPRASGFLTPNIGNSSRFGFVLGQSYFWAINRSYDATIGGTLYTDRGFATQLGFRGRPTATSHFATSFFSVKDRGQHKNDGTRGDKQGGTSASMQGTAQFPGGLRGVTQVNYLSSLEFRQAFTQTFEEAVSSQIRSIGFISKNQSTFSMNVSLLRNENFQSVDDSKNTIVIRNLPSMEFNSHKRQILNGPLPVWFSLDSSFGLVSRTQPEFQTRRFVQRGDFHPRISTKLDWKDFHLTPTFGARHTFYGQRREKGNLIGTNLYRNTKEFSLELAPPSLQRIYNGPKWLGEKIKHVMEPRVIYRYVDGIENFDRVIRFDERDIINTTNEMDVSLINRVYAKDQSGRVREVFALEVWQRRYFDPDFGGALVPGQRNVLQSTISITPFAFADQVRRYSPIVTSMRVQPNWRYQLEWRNDYDTLRGKLVNSSVSMDMKLSDLLSVSVGHNAVRAPTVLSAPSNQFSSTIRVGDFNRRGWNAAVNTIYDYRQKIFLYNVSQLTYNTDCCGFSVEWRRLVLGHTRNENQFRVSLSIANVGSFGMLRPQERLF